MTVPSKIKVVSRAYRRFVGMRTGIYLLAAIAGSLVIGSVASIEVYHTTWFNILLISLGANTALCSLERLLKSFRGGGGLRSCPLIFSEFVSGAVPAKVCTALNQLLEGEGYKTTRKQENEKCLLFGERNVIGRWWDYGTHLSVVLIAAGVLYGAQAGFEATVPLMEGHSQLIVREGKQDFLLRLNSFSASYYKNGIVSEWVCDVSAEREGKDPVRREIRINHPLIFGHTKVYLASQGVLVRVQVQGSGGSLGHTDISPGETVMLPQTQGKTLRIFQFIPDYDPSRPTVSKTQQPRNPYVIYTVAEEHERGKWLAAPVNVPQPLAGETASLVFSVMPVAGLHVKYDPGVPLVWSGFGLLLAGIFFMYYLPYGQVWIQISTRKDGQEIVCAGRGPDLERLRQELMRCCLKSDDCRGRVE